MTPKLLLLAALSMFASACVTGGHSRTVYTETTHDPYYEDTYYEDVYYEPGYDGYADTYYEETYVYPAPTEYEREFIYVYYGDTYVYQNTTYIWIEHERRYVSERHIRPRDRDRYYSGKRPQRTHADTSNHPRVRDTTSRPTTKTHNDRTRRPVDRPVRTKTGGKVADARPERGVTPKATPKKRVPKTIKIPQNTADRGRGLDQSPSDTRTTGKPVNTGRPAHAGKPVNTGRPVNTGKPVDTGGPVNAGRPINTTRPSKTTRPVNTNSDRGLPSSNIPNRNVPVRNVPRQNNNRPEQTRDRFQNTPTTRGKTVSTPSRRNAETTTRGNSVGYDRPTRTFDNQPRKSNTIERERYQPRTRDSAIPQGRRNPNNAGNVKGKPAPQNTTSKYRVDPNHAADPAYGPGKSKSSSKKESGKSDTTRGLPSSKSDRRGAPIRR